LHLAVRFSLFCFGIPRSESQLKLFIFGSGRPARCSLSQSEFPRLPTRWGSSFLLAGRFRFIPTVGAPSATLDPMAFPGSAPLIDFRPSDIFSVPLTRAARSDFFSHTDFPRCRSSPLVEHTGRFSLPFSVCWCRLERSRLASSLGLPLVFYFIEACASVPFLLGLCPLSFSFLRGSASASFSSRPGSFLFSLLPVVPALLARRSCFGPPPVCSPRSS
jgi:hypothetical protein